MPEEPAQEEIRFRVPQVMERPDDPDGAPPGGQRREVVVVRQVRVDHVEALPLDRRAQDGKVAEGAGQRVRTGQQRAGPAQGQDPASQGASPDERELRLDAGVDQGARPVVHHGGDAGPLLAGDDVEDAHPEKLSADSRACRG